MRATAAALLCAGHLAAQAQGGIVSLTEADFAEQLHSSSFALVAFVAPWCTASRLLMQELPRVQTAMAAQKATGLLVAQCDVSTELGLAARYRAWRTPVVLLFPDTQVLAPGFQVAYAGRMAQRSIVAFVGRMRDGLPPQVRSYAEVRKAASSSEQGTFLGFFRSPNTESALLDFWPLDCLKRHSRAFALAGSVSGQEGVGLRTRLGRLWKWAGLTWRPHDDSSEEAIVYIPAAKAATNQKRFFPAAHFTAEHAKAAGVSWRAQVDAFCAWCERQVLRPVAVFDAPRAAALDGTFDWLLLLFAPQGSGQEEPQFLLERRCLESFMAAACARDRRYEELLPVIVPWEQEELAAFRSSFGAEENPVEPLERRSSGGNAATLACTKVPENGTACDCTGTESDARWSSLWAVVLFNTRTRRKYAARRGWRPGDEVALCHFTGDVFTGKVLPLVRSLDQPSAAAVANAPFGVTELVGSTLHREALEPVAAGLAEVLLLLYAPWCSHSINFQQLWHSFAAGVAAAQDAAAGWEEAWTDPTPSGGRQRPRRRSRSYTLPRPAAAPGQLLLAQMDGTQNEHPGLPVVTEFPTVLLCTSAHKRTVSNTSSRTQACERRVELDQLTLEENVHTDLDFPADEDVSGMLGTNVTFLVYDGAASAEALRDWVVQHSAFARPWLAAETFRHPSM